MESPVVRSRGRPRKRRREEARIEEIVDNNIDKGDVQDVVENRNNQENVQITGNARKRGRPPKKRTIVVKGQAMVDRYVMKDFEGSGVFLGKIVSYEAGLYRVEYEDGDCEDLDSDELREYLIGNEHEQLVDSFLKRKMKLDEHIARKMGMKLKDEGKREDVKMVNELEQGAVDKLAVKPDERDIEDLQNNARIIEVPTLSELSGGEVDGSEVDDDDTDSSSDSCEYGQGWETRSETETPGAPPPQLPPSSGNIAVPEEYVSHLFSVYGFLRSFSIRLFLSPFTLDDLVGCLNCTIPSTLLDSIHVALLRALRRHLETLASDGSEIASKCLRCIDWGLLDMLTWPVYLVHYLMVMGHLNGDEWKGFYADVLEKDYCSLSIGMKLTVLQILCDDALDTSEVRAEIDMREGSEVGFDSDGFTSLESEPRKVHPRHCKNSVTKDRENTFLDTDNTLPLSSNSLTMKGSDHNRNVANLDEDGNGDECRLCGMDGVLLCCDGCPSAYHSRCIGVNKLSIPEGEWFCPECTISRIGPTISAGTSLKGAEVFGVDSYAQLFLGTCDHLLVLKVSVKTSHFVRYYNRNDIVKVITLLCSSPHHAVLYFGICQAILKYWGLPMSIIPPLINGQTSMTLESRCDDIMQPSEMHPFMKNGSDKVCHKVELEKYACSVGENIAETLSGSSVEKFSGKPGSGDCLLGVQMQTGVSLGMPMQTDPTSMARVSGATVNQNPTNLTSKLLEQAELSCSTRQGLADKSSITGIASYTSRYNSSSTAGHQIGVSLPENLYMHGKGDGDGVGRRTGQKWNDTCLYMGSFFKPNAYINHFIHGDYAASAAANFVVLSSEENRASEFRSLDPRKVMSANVTLQTKAFSSAAVRFFWPCMEKKLIEVPRERCSWCLHCKAPVTSKKACLLNQAALNATRAEMKFFSGQRLTKNVDGALYNVASYTLYMEESLRGLILGPFQSEGYRKQWRKEVEQALTFSDMKSLLLVLERNLRSVALSNEWTKLADNWMDESSVPQSACPTGSTQKRGPGRRKKHLAAGDTTSDDSNDASSDISWWRGGKLTKVVFQRATLPSSVLKKLARQGGSRKISGIYYADGSDIPKRSRQFIWRAAVGMASNSSQLAFQVRYLDNHIKWSDLVRPEQTVQEGKGSETEASVFRNALICDKKFAENKIIYGVVFGHQKHLSSRVMKSVIEKEESQDGKDKYWFPESRVPLYLIKEYGENAEKTLLPPTKELPKNSPPLSKLQQKQLKAARKNIFCYLDRRKDNIYMCLCASCHQDVVINFAVKCSACEGYCHKECTMSSTVLTDEDVEFITTCKQCSHVKVSKNNSGVESPTSPLVMQGQEYQNSATVARSARSRNTGQQYQNSATVAKSTRSKSTTQQLPPVGTSETPSDKQPTSSDSNVTKNKKRSCHWGLIWKKKNSDEDGSSFRLKNMLFRRNPHDTNVLKPVCYLCKNPYSHDLIYIFCEVCRQWYHADAVELDESKLLDLVGFKCCRCRRIKSPTCPYADPIPKNMEVKKLRIRGPKEEPVPPSSVSEAISEQAESVPSTPMSLMEEDIFIQVDDPLMLSVSEVEQIPEPKAEVDFDWNAPSGPGPQKLPVRRHVKNENDDDGFTGNPSPVQFPTYAEMKNIANPPHAEWDVSDGGLDDGMALDYEDFNCENTDYEPQTYFSFTELLEADDSNHLEGADTAIGACENLPCENSRSGLLEQCEMGSNIDILPMESFKPATCVPCNICSQTAPSPDLYCQNCGLQIHGHCSPWEKFVQGENWMCGNCRVWR